jgi:Holliday junction resolvasome RuvABC endonuclease subunit
VIVIGIDPGLTGGVAMLHGSQAEVWDTPSKLVEVNGKTKRRIDAPALARLIDKAVNCLDPHREARAFVELAQASPRMGVSSAFAYGQAFGLVVGVLAHLDVPVQTVPAAQWKRGMGLAKKGSRELGRDEEREKGSALDLARRLYPQLADELGRIKDNGRADALLLAHWGCEQLEGGLFVPHAKPAPLPEVAF